MVADRVGTSERRRLRRRSFLKRAGGVGTAALAGCVSVDERVEADGPTEELIQEGFAAAGIDPPFETTIAIPQSNERERFAQLFRDSLEETGFFDVSIRAREFGSHVEAMLSAADDGDNAMFVASWTGGWDPDAYVNMLFHSDNHAPAGLNVNHYANDAVDEYIDAGLEETDPDERVAIYRDLQEELVADSPASFVRFSESAHVWNDDVVGDWRAYPLEPGTYYAVYAPWAGVYTDIEGEEFVADLGSDVQNYDPVAMNDTASSQATALLYESLVGVDFDGEVRPILAADWERRDATTYRFSLREGVRFHNGERLTAAHVEGSFERYEGTTRETDVYDWYEGCEIVDDTTVDVHCWREYGPFEEALFNVPIVPMAAIDGEHDLESEPIGTGPYRFADHRTDDHWRLERFDDHWFDGDGTVPATPPVETVTLEIVTERAARQSALEAGNVDFSYGVSPASLSEFEAADEYGVDRHVGGGFDMVVYPRYLEPFSEVSVRRGCNALFPRETVREQVYHGLGRIAYTPISPLLEAYADESFQESIADEYVRPE
jgi:peptide/nickel transport system substrate-binding protein